MAIPAPNGTRSIFTAQIVSYLLVIFALASIFSFFFFSTARDHLEDEVARKLRDIASIAARNVPVERIELIRASDDESRMVRRLLEKLDEIREATGVESIVVFRPDLTALLPAPGAKIGDRIAPRRFDEGALASLSAGHSVSTGTFRGTGGNLYMSVWAPITTPAGALVAIVGVNAGTREVEVIESMRARLYLVTALGAMFGVLLAIVLARTLTRPIRSMADTARRIGRGEYDARVPPPAASELRVLAESINGMAEQVRRRDDSLKEISASVAHEIRNPLNSIKLLVTLLGEELRESGAPPSRTIETLHREVGKLNRFLTEFLTYSRPIRLSARQADPGDIARAAAEMAAGEAESAGVAIDLLVEEGLPGLRADRDRLEQSLLNILLNAVQASPEGGRVAVLVRRAHGEEDFVEFVIDDTGPGIPKDVQDKLFDPFFTTREAGTGLGLSNADKIVRGHGGSIAGENRAGGGARFVVRIPAAGGEAEA
ncbi:HAMP domain-containing protein [bacterium]|nr:HAMP domain-containing protein [bacterium]